MLWAPACKDYNYNLVLSHLAHSMFMTDCCSTSGKANLNTYIPQTRHEPTKWHFPYFPTCKVMGNSISKLISWFSVVQNYTHTTIILTCISAAVSRSMLFFYIMMDNMAQETNSTLLCMFPWQLNEWVKCLGVGKDSWWSCIGVRSYSVLYWCDMTWL